MTAPEVLRLAREIASKALRDRKMPSPSYEAIDVEAGKYDEHSAVQAAIAAIERTTELAAIFRDKQEAAKKEKGIYLLKGWGCLEDYDHLRQKEQPKMNSYEILNSAKKLYHNMVDNHPTIHCNRFPAWWELADEEKEQWILKAKDETKMSKL